MHDKHTQTVLESIARVEKGVASAVKGESLLAE